MKLILRKTRQSESLRDCCSSIQLEPDHRFTMRPVNRETMELLRRVHQLRRAIA